MKTVTNSVQNTCEVLSDWQQLQQSSSAAAANNNTDQFSSSIRVPQWTKPANGELKYNVDMAVCETEG
jgi:hypothetical protein